MNITEVFTCECNGGKPYANRRSFNEHKKSKKHQRWEQEKEILDIRCRCKRLENEVECLKYDLVNYRNLCMKLQIELKDLKQ